MSREIHDVINEALRLTGDIDLHANLAEFANLQAAKPEQAQTAVGVPEPTWWRLYGNVYEVQQHNITTDEPIPDQEPLFIADQMESYATAKTAEAVRELVDMLQECLDCEFAVSEKTVIADARTLIAKYAPKKEQDNG